MLLKCADISNVSKPFSISKKWGILMTEEFLFQGDAEKQRGINPPTINPQQKMLLAQSQLGFISNVVLPLLETVTSLCQGLVFFRDSLLENAVKWKVIIAEEVPHT
jgi:cAMP-specific phosphodiesterase